MLDKNKVARSPYRVLISEIMLQQTQVSRVEGKYEPFLRRFPNFRALAAAPSRDLLAAWEGMGYNRRALALKRIAERVVRERGGVLPQNPQVLETFPGIGKGTAGSIAAFAYNLPVPFIETNIRRVFIHYFFQKRRKVRDEEILHLVGKTLDRKNPREWYYALMDYGAALGKGTKDNPNRKSAHYRKQTAFEGSKRQVRSKILRLVMQKSSIPEEGLYARISSPRDTIQKALKELVREGFVQNHKKRITIKA